MVGYNLRYLDNKCDLEKSEEVKTAISEVNGANSYKQALVKSYHYYVMTNGFSWDRPHYKWEQRLPKIPTREQIDKIISGTSKRYATVFRILVETGVTPKELSNLRRNDIDTEAGVLNFQGCKGHSSRSFKLKPSTHVMLMEYLARLPAGSGMFPDSYWMSKVWRRARKSQADKLMDPSLVNIRLYDLRHHLHKIIKSYFKELVQAF